MLFSVQLVSAAKIRGKVLDKETGEPLLGATVMVKGTALGTATAFDGTFEIDAKKDQALVISYISYLSQEIVAERGLDDLMVSLAPDTQMLASVKVVAKVSRETELAAMVDQKNAIFATQIVGVKELSRKGVGDAEGAVMKVSGISKQEGVKNVFVRGLGDRYNSTTLNGLPIPSEDPEYKNISLDFFSTDIIQSVVVNKAFYAPGVSDVGGANINITSKELSGDGEFNVSLSGGINSQTLGADMVKADGVSGFGYANNKLPSNFTDSYSFENDLDPTAAKGNFNRSFGLSGGKKFEVAGNPLSFFAVASYDHSASYMDEVVRKTDTSGRVTTDQDAAISEFSDTHMAMANANYEIGKKHSIDYNFMYIHSNTQSVGDYVGTDSETFQENIDSKGMVRRQQTNDNSLYVNQLITKWELNSRFDLNVSGSYNKIVGLEPDRRINTFGLVENTSGELVYDLMKGTATNCRTFSELNESDINGQAVVSYKLSDELNSKSKIDFGYRTRMVDNSFMAHEYDTNLYGNPGFEIGNVQIDSFFNDTYLNEGWFTIKDNVDEYTVDKMINSTFADLTLEATEKLIVNVGFKLDMVDIDVNSYVDETTTVTELKKNYYLPSLNLKYSLNDDQAIRLSVSETYTLPQSKELSPYRYVGPSFNSEGNPNLQPSTNYNVDLKWDWYISPGELISVTGYYKNIVDPISRIQEMSAGGFLSYQNIADKATVAGIEFELRKNLFNKDMGLSRTNKLSFGFNGSYIYTNAKVEQSTDNMNDANYKGSQLEGAAPFIANTDLSFTMNRKEKSFTNTLVFNYVSDKIYTLGCSGYDNIIENGTSTLDFVSTAKLNDKVSLSLKAKNLLNTTYKFTREPSSSNETVVLNEYQKGIDLSLGLSYSF